MTASIALQSRLQNFVLQRASTPMGTVQYRQAGASLGQTTHVLLHGIGSGSGSWLMQLEAAVRHTHRLGLLAWEAPGYGASTPVRPLAPLANDYAARLWNWLDTLGVRQPITLVGHSLGALMAASAAVTQPSRVARLVLLAPAQGYGHANVSLRRQKLLDRLQALQTLGPQGMANKRSAAMLSSHAHAQQLAYVQHIMAQVNPSGYTQAAQMLSQGHIASDLKRCSAPIAIASGRADGITPMAGCQSLAADLGLPWHDLGDVGHACPLEGAPQVNALLGLDGRFPA
jgi:pimeloyl-ACP methyl ester carboxylesterase